MLFRSIAQHFDKEHPHVHIAFNRIDNNGNTISDRHERLRSTRICKEMCIRDSLQPLQPHARPYRFVLFETYIHESVSSIGYMLPVSGLSLIHISNTEKHKLNI